MVALPIRVEEHGTVLLQHVRIDAEKAGELEIAKACREEIDLRDSLGRMPDCSKRQGDCDCLTRDVPAEERCLSCALYWREEARLQAYNEAVQARGLFFALGVVHNDVPVH